MSQTKREQVISHIRYLRQELREMHLGIKEDDYNTPFDGLKDWHLLRAIAINRPELTTNYTHLLDQEPFDEN